MSWFFDTNVIVYALDASSDPRHPMADELVARHLLDGTLWISTQVLQETYSALVTKKGVAGATVLEGLRAFAPQRIVGATPGSVLRALDLGLSHRLSVWDALIVQAALDAGCTTLLSEDLQHGRRFGRLEVVNPFAPAVHEPPAAYRRRPAAAQTRRRS